MAIDIPFEKQIEKPNNRMCGAACLSMIYKYYGIPDDQLSIWSRIKDKDGIGNLFAFTYKICADLLNHNINSLIIQAIKPLEVLKICDKNNFSAILVHRVKRNSNFGHFTVFNKIEGDRININDPMKDKPTRIYKKTILDLWKDTGGDEVFGNILIPITKNHTDKYLCSECKKEIPISLKCPNCNAEQVIPLTPKETLGCVNDGCSQKTWNFIVCPFCDQRIYEVN